MESAKQDRSRIGLKSWETHAKGTENAEFGLAAHMTAMTGGGNEWSLTSSEPNCNFLPLLRLASLEFAVSGFTCATICYGATLCTT